MSLLANFDTPASLRDAGAAHQFYTDWSDYVSGLIGGTTLGNGGGAFYNPTQTDVSVAGEKAMTWMGFPRDLILPGNRDNKPAAYLAADGNASTRSRQNEYFEWQVETSNNKITKITFVTELPEYYEQMWATDPALVVALYRSILNNNAIQQSDLETATGAYNKFNRYNTTDGIVHYIQRINTLTAAVGLCKQSVTAPAPYRDNYEANVDYATARTSVDPRVSYDVHMLVRKGLYVTLKDPIGIYIADWDGSGITHPDGSPADNYWNVTRGNTGMVLRLEYEVPASKPFVVGDLKIGGRRIEYGGQLAEFITVVVSGTAGTINQR
ncbi:MAG: hypothetical protein HEP71_31930 [Roseivirga sp.]|nr:hypothetical protein [Roseivirga sp.]